jgi:hypothetical protein
VCLSCLDSESLSVSINIRCRGNRCLPGRCLALHIQVTICIINSRLNLSTKFNTTRISATHKPTVGITENFVATTTAAHGEV